MGGCAALCTVSLWVVWILGLIKWASAERDLTRLSSSFRCSKLHFARILALLKNLTFGKNWAQHHSHFLNPHSPRGQHRFRDWLDSSLLQADATTKPAFRTPPGPLSHFHTASAREYWSLSHSSSESWHKLRSLIPCKDRRSLRLTLFILASKSPKYIHGLQSNWALFHTRLTELSPWEVVLLFAPSAYEWCEFLDSSSGPQPNETWQDCPHHSGEEHHAQSSSWCKVRKLVSTTSGASSMRTLGPVHIQGWLTTHVHCGSESWHRLRSLIPCKGRRSLRLTLFILANNP